MQDLPRPLRRPVPAPGSWHFPPSPHPRPPGSPPQRLSPLAAHPLPHRERSSRHFPHPEFRKIRDMQLLPESPQHPAGPEYPLPDTHICRRPGIRAPLCFPVRIPRSAHNPFPRLRKIPGSPLYQPFCLPVPWRLLPDPPYRAPRRFHLPVLSDPRCPGLLSARSRV